MRGEKGSKIMMVTLIVVTIVVYILNICLNVKISNTSNVQYDNLGIVKHS